MSSQQNDRAVRTLLRQEARRCDAPDDKGLIALALAMTDDPRLNPRPYRPRSLGTLRIAAAVAALGMG